MSIFNPYQKHPMPRILIIDDEKSIRRTLREILEYENFKVEEAADGQEGRPRHEHAAER